MQSLPESKDMECYARNDNAFESQNWDNAMAAGKEALSFQLQYREKFVDKLVDLIIV